MARVVVIGGGVGGLAVAARLSVKRHDVTVLEQADTIGGKLARYSRDGFVFDTGPSLLTLPAVYRDLFLKTGKQSLEESVDLQPVEPGFRYYFADGSNVVLPGVGVGACANRLGEALGGSARSDWMALMERAREIWRLTRRPVLESPVAGLRDLRPLVGNLRDVRTVAPYLSMHRIAERYLSDPRLVTLADRYATYTGSSPFKAPAALMTIPYVEQTFGAWHIGGGLATLSQALVQRCEQRRVTIRTGTRVTKVLTNQDGVVGVELVDGERVPADVVVSDCDARVLYEDLLADDERAKQPRQKLRRSPTSFSGFVLMLAVAGRTPGITHHNVWFPQAYRDEFDDLAAGRPVRDPAIYACVPDDPDMRPDQDCEAWSILVNAPRHGSAVGEFDWSNAAFTTQYADHIVDTLARRGCDLRGRIIWRETRTPADLESSTNSPGGAIYGSSSNGARAAFSRPANQSPIPGLFLVGGSSHPGGGLPLVGLSAEIVANLVGRG